jgi:hypothetical protein
MPYRSLCIFSLFLHVQLTIYKLGFHLLPIDYQATPATPTAAQKIIAISAEYQVDGTAAPFWSVASPDSSGLEALSAVGSAVAPTVAKEVMVDCEPFGSTVVRYRTWLKNMISM